MGLTYIKASIANPARPKRTARVRFLVDSGAFYSVVPKPVLRRLGIKSRRTKSFILADGTEIKRSLGQALFRLNGEEAASPVIFGEKGDSVLLGSVSLEALGFMLDPLKRELRPLPMLLASHSPSCVRAWQRSSGHYIGARGRRFRSSPCSPRQPSL